MTISATIPVALLDQANAHLESLGFGPNNFSVPMKASGEAATHAGLSCWGDVAFEQALSDMAASGDYAGLSLGTDFYAQAEAQALDWSDPTEWTQNPVMKGDQRTYSGKLWESLMDYNVWAPPIGWREIVADGWPEWQQPTGAHDAYKIGDKVTFQGSRYTSLINANVWSPTAYPAGWAKQV